MRTIKKGQGDDMTDEIEITDSEYGVDEQKVAEKLFDQLEMVPITNQIDEAAEEEVKTKNTDKLDQFRKMIEDKVSKYDPNDKGEDSEFKRRDGMKELKWCEMVTRFATTCDKVLLFWAFFGTSIIGAIRPGFSFAFG